MDHKLNVVMLCGDWQSSNIMYNGIADHTNVVCVVSENKPSSKKLLQRRMKNLGFFRTLGQVLFILVNKFLARFSEPTIKQLLTRYALDFSPPPQGITVKVESVNDAQTVGVLQQYQPDAVVVNGTRIIDEKVLSSVDAPFLNTHMGITPKYRGAHGGYWALAMDDRDNCGVTIHLVDQGIDTGSVLYQDTIDPDDSDDINTYPLHQIAKAIPLMRSALDDIANNRLREVEGVGPSRLWYHPTLFQYVRYWIGKGVK